MQIMGLSFLSGLTMRTRIVLLVIVASFPGLILAIYLAIDYRQYLIRDSERNLLNQVLKVADAHHQLLSLTRRTLAVLSTLPSETLVRPACESLLLRVAELGKYANVGIVTTSGNLVCSAIAAPPDFSASERLWFRRAINSGDFVVGEFQTGRITGIPVLVAAQPVRQREGAVYIVFAALPIDLFTAPTFDSLPDGTAVTLVDDAGTVVAGTTETALLGTRLPSSFLDVMKRSTTFVATGIDRVERMYAVASVSAEPVGRVMWVLYGVPISAIAFHVRELVWSVGLLFAVTTILLVALAWWGTAAVFSRQARPIVAMAEKIAAGDYSARAPDYPGRTEPAVVANALNHMAESLQTKMQQTDEYLARIQRLNCAHGLSSISGSTVARALSKEELLAEVCTLATSSCKFLSAWAGAPQNDALHVYASAGVPSSEIARLFSEKEALRVVASVIDKRRSTLAHLPSADARTPIACALYPIISDESSAVLAFCKNEDEIFDEAEVRLLGDVAANVHLGLAFLQKNRQLAYFANYEPLTGLANRTLFAQRLAATIMLSRHAGHLIAVGIIGVKRLADIQFTHGYAAGDQVVRSVASALPRALPDAMVIASLARGEYAFVIDQISDPTAVAGVAEAVLDRCPRSVELQSGEQVYLWYSLGVSFYPIDGAQIDELIDKAQSALHSASLLERNAVVFFSPPLERQAKARLRIEQALREAVDRDELEVYYQPIVDARTRKIHSFEALLRWSPRQGPVAPSTFIPIAEQTGIIAALGELVLRKVCTRIVAWTPSWPDLSVAVNVSVLQLQQAEQVARLLELLSSQACRAAGARVAIEVTESQLMSNVGVVYATLHRLKDIGVPVYIDDFGTGYSSLSYLRRLPIDALKIDQSFIAALGKDSESEIIVRGIITMAHELGLAVIAEGVENQTQLDILNADRCDFAQGHLFHKAVPGGEVLALGGHESSSA